MNTVWIVFSILSFVEIKAQVNPGSSVHFGERNINNNDYGDDDDTTTTTPFTGDVNIYPELRLVGSQNGNPNEGFVIIKTHNDSWGSIAFYRFQIDKTAVAKVACRTLGFK